MSLAVGTYWTHSGHSVELYPREKGRRDRKMYQVVSGLEKLLPPLQRKSKSIMGAALRVTVLLHSQEHAKG